ASGACGITAERSFGARAVRTSDPLRSGVAPASPGSTMEPPRYAMPPHLHGETGSIRRVGVEIEFAGLEIEEAIGIVCELFGGHPVSKNRFEHTIEGTRFGDFRVEVDSTPLTERRYLAFLERL